MTDACRQESTLLARWFGIGGSSEEAAELYASAAQAFELAMAWPEAVLAYDAVANSKATGNDERVSALINVARCQIRAGALDDAQKTLSDKVELMLGVVGLRSYTSLAKVYETLATGLQDADSNSAATDAYTQAATYYDAGDRSSDGRRCRIAAARTNPSRMNAALVLEAAADECAAKPILSFQSHGFYLDAGLCLLATQDVVGASNLLDRANDKCYTFAGSTQGRFLSDLVAICQDMNVDQFVSCTSDMDATCHLDPWRIKTLLAARKTIENFTG